MKSCNCKNGLNTHQNEKFQKHIVLRVLLASLVPILLVFFLRSCTNASINCIKYIPLISCLVFAIFDTYIIGENLNSNSNDKEIKKFYFNHLMFHFFSTSFALILLHYISNSCVMPRFKYENEFLIFIIGTIGTGMMGYYLGQIKTLEVKKMMQQNKNEPIQTETTSANVQLDSESSIHIQISFSKNKPNE